MHCVPCWWTFCLLKKPHSHFMPTPWTSLPFDPQRKRCNSKRDAFQCNGLLQKMITNFWGRLCIFNFLSLPIGRHCGSKEGGPGPKQLSLCLGRWNYCPSLQMLTYCVDDGRIEIKGPRGAKGISSRTKSGFHCYGIECFVCSEGSGLMPPSFRLRDAWQAFWLRISENANDANTDLRDGGTSRTIHRGLASEGPNFFRWKL